MVNIQLFLKQLATYSYLQKELTRLKNLSIKYAKLFCYLRPYEFEYEKLKVVSIVQKVIVSRKPEMKN